MKDLRRIYRDGTLDRGASEKAVEVPSVGAIREIRAIPPCVDPVTETITCQTITAGIPMATTVTGRVNALMNVYDRIF